MRAFWSLSLRARLMTIGVAGMLIGLTVGALGLYATLRFAVNRTLDNEALAAAHEVAAMVNTRRLPAPIPVSGAQVIQVVDSGHRVVSGSATADRLTPLLNPAELATALEGRTVLVPGSRAGVAGPLRVTAIRAGPAADPVSVLVAVQAGDALAGLFVLRASLLVVIPLLVAVLAVVAWRVIGWTLRPVEQLRLGAERIGSDVRLGAGAEARLPVPEAADEIRALALTLNDMLARLAASRERQRAFVADAAHELRSPLASMRAQLEVAQHLGEGGRLPAELLAEVNRLAGLVEDLLLLARSDADGPVPARVSTFDARTLLAGLVEGYASARVPVRLAAEAPVPVRADPDELRRAVANLVDNAVRHARTEVRVDLACDGEQVVIGVVDDGPGIPPADRERVFERFTRLDDARDRDAGGSGLGLAITRELLRRAGGTVAFSPDPALSRAEIRLGRTPAPEG